MVNALRDVIPTWNKVTMVTEEEILTLRELRDTLVPVEILVKTLCKANFNTLQVRLTYD